jgi:hypothetical protein
MSEEEKQSTYARRDFMLGEIHERTKCIPDLKRDVGKLSRKVAVIEVKSGFFGLLGGVLTIVGLQIKHYFSMGGNG